MKVLIKNTENKKKERYFKARWTGMTNKKEAFHFDKKEARKIVESMEDKALVMVPVLDKKEKRDDIVEVTLHPGTFQDLTGCSEDICSCKTCPEDKDVSCTNVIDLCGKQKTDLVAITFIEQRSGERNAAYWLSPGIGSTEDLQKAFLYTREDAEDYVEDSCRSTIIEISVDSKGILTIPKEITEAFEPDEFVVSPKRQFDDILSSLGSLLEYKNEKYGNVALQPMGIFSDYGTIGVRLDDKLSRIMNSEELRKNDVADLMGYLVLLCKEHGFESFEEFKD